MDKNIQKKIQNRQKFNKLILKKLDKLFEEYPDLRFCQGLINIGILEVDDSKQEFTLKDPFNDESQDIYERIKY